MSLTRRAFLGYSGALASGAILGSLSPLAGEEPAGKRPNIVVIFSDELDHRFIGCYGGKYPTPNIDSLARDGLRFDRAYTPSPMCTPSRFSLLTGQFPGRCSTEGFLEAYPRTEPYNVSWNTNVDSSTQTMAKVLSANGYVTGMVGKWHLGGIPDGVEVPAFSGDESPQDDEVEAKLRRRQEVFAAQLRDIAGFEYAASVAWGNLDMFPVEALRHHNIPWITKGAVEFLDTYGRGDRPFFLYAATTAVHGPHHGEMYDHDLRYTPGGFDPEVPNYGLDAEMMKAKLAGLPSHEQHRLAGMMALDHHVGRILEKIRELGIEKETLVVFLADHNIEPGKATCYEQGCRMPMMARWPGRIAPGRVTTSLAETVDWFPTALALAGIRPEAGLRLDGEDLLPLLRGEEREGRDSVYLESGYARGITDGTFKYIAVRFPRSILERMKNGELTQAPNYLTRPRQAHSQIAIEYYPHYFDADQLYDLRSDPYEQRNLAGDPQYGEVLDSMKGRLARVLATFSHPYDLEKDPFYDSEEYARLAEATREVGIGHIEWLKRDHGTIEFPPE